MKEAEAIATLKEIGLWENVDYFIEHTYRIETYWEARSVCIVSESAYESGNYDRGEAQVEHELHTEKDVVGFQILDKDLKETSIEDLCQKFDMTVPNGHNNCGICGKPLVRNHYGFKDQREIDGQLRCFDHIGQPTTDASPPASSDSGGED